MNRKSKKRLSKVLASAGIASRRAAEKLIFDRRVTVNGEVTIVPQTLVSLEEDEICVDGKKVEREEEKVYFLLNKPRGYLSSNKRFNKNSKLVIDLFPDYLRLFTAGRLDKDTEGLLIVTNDGLFANKIIHPSSNIQKEYLVKTNKEITPNHLKLIAEGTVVEEAFVKPTKVTKVRKGTLKITVKEGKKHEVRKLIEKANLEVKMLKRIRVGPFVLGNLPVGTYRPLSEPEIQQIFDL